MVIYRAADAGQWAASVERRLDLVVRQSANDLMLRASQTAPGVGRGGAVRPGFVPRDTGFLAASLISSLQGGSVTRGEDGWRLVVTQMKAGQVAIFGWTAEYTKPVHYRGWLWVSTAANAWPQIVAAVVARATRGG